MKRVMLTAVCLLALVLAAGCGGQYSDVKKVNEEYIGMVETYIAALDKADDKDDVVKAMNNFTDDLEDIWPRMQALREKYPELDSSEPPPEELKASMEQAEKVGAKIGTSFMKIMQYMDDPEVQAAQQRMGQVMMKQ